MSNRIVCFFIVLILSSISINAQEQKSVGEDSNLKLYLDCQYCDMDYFRQELKFASLVRDRQQAELHILVTRQRTGNGGREYTLEFIGKNRFEGMNDTLKYNSQESDTDDNIRLGLKNIIRIGLTRFIAQTDNLKFLEVIYNKPDEYIVKEIDKWKNWTFSISANSWINGQKSYRSINLYSRISAKKVTEMNRFVFSFWGNYNEDKFDYEDYKALSISRSRGADIAYYKGINDHWSVGASSSILSSTYSNKKLSSSFAPIIEFNLYPYSESNNRQLRCSYRILGNYIEYDEITIYDKTSEELLSHRLSFSLELIQPWGSIETTLRGSNYFHDFDKNRLELYNEVSVRLFEGFSVNINGNISRVRDQLSLRKGDASDEDVLLRQRELATNYNYWANIGISYTFGSSNNNIVNPRFGY